MSHPTDSRRRFLAFLGLMGAPAAMWSTGASAQSTPPAEGISPAQGPSTFSDLMAAYADEDIHCSATLEENPRLVVYYDRNLILIGDRLSLLSYDDKSRITVTAAASEYGDGFSDGGTTIYQTIMSPEVTQFEARQPETGVLGVFTTYLKADPAPQSVYCILVTPSGEVASDGGSYTAGSTPGVYRIETDWSKTPADVLDGPFKVVLSLDGFNQAVFDFDVAASGGVALLKARSDELEAAEGVHVDEDGNVAGAPDCTVGDNDSYSDPYDPGCFFTTAAVGTLGMADDCWELRTLRAFRDGPLAHTVRGHALVAQYYAQAPRLVDGINRRTDAARIWLCHYWSHVLPCAILARLGFNALAVKHYRDLFARLERLSA